MKILVACEFSQIVTEQFLNKGHDVVSCDIRPSEKDLPHLQQDVIPLLDENWDLMIAHPPCTYTAVTGNRWYKNTSQREEGIEFFMKFINAPINKIAVEHPVSVISGRYRKPTQYIEPFQFGHTYSKKTGLWLKNLPKLIPTDIVKSKGSYIWAAGSPSVAGYDPITKGWAWNSDKLRKYRARFPVGIAKAMAEQWS